MNEPILQAESLSFAYEGGRHVLEDLSFTVRPGERVAVLGGNGAGKSTFFLCLNGVLSPHHGEIRLHGEPVTKSSLNALRAKVGMVFQNADDQIIAPTVLAEISFGPMNLRLPRAEVERRVNDAIAFMGLEDFRARPPHYLSGGEKKRVAIADILAMEPEVILFDEPQAALDPEGAALLEGVLDDLHAAGKTLLISTHDMDFAYRWADRIVVFCAGEIIADGAPDAVFGDSAVLSRAGLRRPVLFEVAASLRGAGVLAADAPAPRTPAELDKLLEGA